MMMSHLRRARLPLIAVSLCLAASGCGGGNGGDSSGTDPAPTAASPAQSGQPTSGTAAATPSQAPGTAGATSEPALAPCTAAVLTGVVEDTPGGGAAGSAYRTLVLTNTSEAACSTGGFPGVSSLDPTGGQVGAPAARTDAVPVPVILQPGQAAAAELRETQARNYGEACLLTETAALLVYPPEDTAALQVPHASVGCANEDITLLTIGVLTPR